MSSLLTHDDGGLSLPVIGAAGLATLAVVVAVAVGSGG